MIYEFSNGLVLDLNEISSIEPHVEGLYDCELYDVVLKNTKIFTCLEGKNITPEVKKEYTNPIIDKSHLVGLWKQSYGAKV